MSMRLRDAVEKYRQEVDAPEVAHTLGMLLRTCGDVPPIDEASVLRLALARILCAEAEATNEPYERLDQIRQLAHEALGQREE